MGVASSDDSDGTVYTDEDMLRPVSQPPIFVTSDRLLVVAHRARPLLLGLYAQHVSPGIEEHNWAAGFRAFVRSAKTPAHPQGTVLRSSFDLAEISMALAMVTVSFPRTFLGLLVTDQAGGPREVGVNPLRATEPADALTDAVLTAEHVDEARVTPRAWELLLRKQEDALGGLLEGGRFADEGEQETLWRLSARDVASALISAALVDT